MPKNTPLQGKQEWEEEFGKQFGVLPIIASDFMYQSEPLNDELKAFIRSLLASQKAELEKEWRQDFLDRQLKNIEKASKNNANLFPLQEEKECECFCHIRLSVNQFSCPHCQKGKK